MKHLVSTTLFSSLLALASFAPSAHAGIFDQPGVWLGQHTFLYPDVPEYCALDMMMGPEFDNYICTAKLAIDGTAATLTLDGYNGSPIVIQGFETVDVILKNYNSIGTLWAGGDYGIKADAKTLNITSENGSFLTISSDQHGIVNTKGSVNIGQNISFYMTLNASNPEDLPDVSLAISTPYDKSVTVYDNDYFDITNSEANYFIATGEFNKLSGTTSLSGSNRFMTKRGEFTNIEDVVYVPEKEQTDEPENSATNESGDENGTGNASENESGTGTTTSTDSSSNNSDKSGNAVSGATKKPEANTTRISAEKITAAENKNTSEKKTEVEAAGAVKEEGERIELKEDGAKENDFWPGLMLAILLGGGLGVVINSLRVRTKILARA
ncbi:hypothetical protein IKE71_00805 [Candidatus Saccharibacteria bacterium]|nr:hypothetical protein [Candidatus Saccharibacteria bacterium]